MIAIHPNFITDEKGKKNSAVITMKEFKTLISELEELEDIKLYDESKKDKEPAVSRSKAKAMIEAEKQIL
ncbi:MAG: hypothetical protein WCK82_13285 [Bacteroidota bacterium]